MSYNGWENWETWNMALCMDNDESPYSLRESARGDGFTADTAKDVCIECFPNGTPDFIDVVEKEGVGVADMLRRIDWQEIADVWNSEESN